MDLQQLCSGEEYTTLSSVVPLITETYCHLQEIKRWKACLWNKCLFNPGCALPTKGVSYEGLEQKRRARTKVIHHACKMQLLYVSKSMTETNPFQGLYADMPKRKFRQDSALCKHRNKLRIPRSIPLHWINQWYFMNLYCEHQVFATKKKDFI